MLVLILLMGHATSVVAEDASQQAMDSTDAASAAAASSSSASLDRDQSPPTSLDQDQSPPLRDEQQQQQQQPPTPPKTKETDSSFNVKDHMDWGSYYDPKNVFCGKYDCYRILGFDYESFGKNIPDTKVITKRYRQLSREWHPDKSKHRDAKERFVVRAKKYAGKNI